MDSRTPPSRVSKRPIEDSSIERARKKPYECIEIKDEDDGLGVEKIYKFRVLMPNGATVGVKVRALYSQMPLQEFVDVVKKMYVSFVRQTMSQKPRRKINWASQELHFTDVYEKTIRNIVNFKNFKPNEWHILRLHDGSHEADTYENMWDLTPDTDLLKELPDEYTFETALADLIDNSLQALWSNNKNQRRLISVDVRKSRISIFDTGPGMDGSDENSIVKWGKMGASLHRSSRGLAIGGEPPYLTPFFGMFGYGGPIAAMHLGRGAVVSSKTKNSKKVYTLHLERDALISSSSSEKTWRANGGVRAPLEDEIEKSPDGSFTKVEIFEPKMGTQDMSLLQCKLKDIYFPYIQCDEMSGKTGRPIEFQVNGTDLAEIEGGEIAITNLHSCNGPEFVIQLQFSFNTDTTSTVGQRQRIIQEANARLKCVYFPIVEGKESIEKILDKLKEDRIETGESYEGFSRVSIRRPWLPFMEPRQKIGERAQILKRLSYRVKCFVETDAGFNPTPSKTDLAHHHPYTTALKNFGHRALETEKELQIKICRSGKILTLSQLEKQYQDWILEMHDLYDEEIDSGEDQPTLVVVPEKNKKLGISSDVVRIHKVIKRKGTSWEAGQKIKVLKGACAGCHKSNVYATLEYIVLEGLQGDACGEARLICRPLGRPEDQGCLLSVDNGNNRIDVRSSLSLPIGVIDSGKCIAISDTEWENQIEKACQKSPSIIDVLNHSNCQELEVDGALPVDDIEAGYAPPEKIIAVVRPKAFNPISTSENLNQKFIVRENFEMSLEVKFQAYDRTVGSFNHVYSGRITPSSYKGFHGLYIFPVGSKLSCLFQKAGIYTFFFSLKELRDVNYERRVRVKGLSEVDYWKVLSEKREASTIRIGSYFPPLSVACYDRYSNRVRFTCVPELTTRLGSNSAVLAHKCSMNVDLTPDKLSMQIKDISVISNELDKIQPSYEASLIISSLDEKHSVAIACRVIPEAPQRVMVHPTTLSRRLLPGQIIKELVLELFDSYGNHIKEDEVIQLHADGFFFLDKAGYVCKVDDRGCVDLSGSLKVSKGYDKHVSVSVLFQEKVLDKLVFTTEMRSLTTASTVIKHCAAGSQLENLVFEIVNSEGEVDRSIHGEEEHGQFHALMLKSDTFYIDDSVRYNFLHGQCCIRSIRLPQRAGIFSFTAAHSRYPELNLDIEVHVEQDLTENHVQLQSSYGNILQLRESPSLRVPRLDQENISPQSAVGKLILFNDSPSLKVPKVDQYNVQNENSDGKISGLQDSPAFEDRGNFSGSIVLHQKGLEEEICKYGLFIGEHERNLKMLKYRQSQIQALIEEKQSELMEITSQLDEEHRAYQRTLKTFHSTRNRYLQFLSENGSVLGTWEKKSGKNEQNI
ncbi:gamma-irradiation and mitomycin c induced 1 [Abeliophyllum distichum]|uniref:Gamma-irradiation and mitomycin c induced 1 n=1 Tax=Abeliophyllum distichum TaxID=126358 RepID=A0ABD1VU65_9LAMI